MFNIKGHSGCDLTIFVEGGKSFVKKMSASPDYDQRLLAQSKKQELFYKKLRDKLELVVPSILETGPNFFSMDFFHGKDPVTFFMTSSDVDVDAFFTRVTDFISYEIDQCQVQPFNKEIFLQKFYDVRERVKSSSINFNLIEARFQQLPVQDLPVGTCHGDLTFSNMIIGRNNRICLIDFLDTFYESPIQDMVKIRQDTLYNWTPMVYNKIYDPVRYSIIMEYLDNKFDSFFKKHDFYVVYYDSFQVINYLRILPYVRTDEIRSSVTTSLEEMTERWT